MGTKRPFDENLQDFTKHQKHLENRNKPDLFEEEEPSLGQALVFSGGGGEKVIAVPDMGEEMSDTSAPLPLVTEILGRVEASGSGPGFCPNLFSQFYDFNLPRRPLVHYDIAYSTYSTLLNCIPRKEVPTGPEHQANVPEFDSDSARNYISNKGREDIFMGLCVISNQEGKTVITQLDCKCVDDGSIRCVQQHVNEARLTLKQCLGLEKFANLGFSNMGEEVACNWTEEEQQHFQDIIYSNPASHGKRFWEVLSVEFPTRTKRELVSYYFNVFIYRRRAFQNRSQLLAVDSDDDEWWGTKNGSFDVIVDEDEFVVVRPFVDHENHDHDHQSLSEDDGIVIGVKEHRAINGSSSSNTRVEKVTSENEHEKVVLGNGFGSKSEPFLHWDPQYSTMGSTKGVNLLPTCSMIEGNFGSSETSKST